VNPEIKNIYENFDSSTCGLREPQTTGKEKNNPAGLLQEQVLSYV
jgi:hypothetical protein